MTVQLLDRDAYAVYHFGILGLIEEARIAASEAANLTRPDYRMGLEDTLHHLEEAVELCRLLRTLRDGLEEGGYLPRRTRPQGDASHERFTFSDTHAYMLLAHATDGLVESTASTIEADLRQLYETTSREHWETMAPRLLMLADGAAALLRLYRHLEQFTDQPMYKQPPADD